MTEVVLSSAKYPLGLANKISGMIFFSSRATVAKHNVPPKLNILYTFDDACINGSYLKVYMVYHPNFIHVILKGQDCCLRYQ